MESQDLDELLDRIVALYADRVANGRAGDVDDLLSQVPDAQRPALARCLEMVELGAAPLAVPKPLVPGSVLGGCRIVATIGRGGVATVHRAEQTALRRTVALKVLRPGLAVDPRQVARFRREGLAVARLEHPNVVKIHDVGQQDGHLYLVMELVDGKDLAKALEELPPAPARTGADLERALRSGDRLGGHIVQGHVDGVAQVARVESRADAQVLDLALPSGLAELMVQHGSVAVDGVSLTVNDLPAPNVLQISLIAYTLARTNLGSLGVGDPVHIEADMLGKYVQRLLEPWDT